MITDRQLQDFRERGYFLTAPQFSAAELRGISAEFERLWRLEIAATAATGDQAALLKAEHRAFIGQAHSKSEVLAEVVHAPIYQEACRLLVGPDADLYYNQVVIKSPRQGRQFGWHQDSGYTTTVPLAYITCWTAITATTRANGCIWLIPGSHHRGLLPHAQNTEHDSWDAVLEDERGAIPVEMEPGQVAIFSSLMLHRSGPNTSDGPRFGYVPQYHVAGARMASSGQPWGDQLPVLRGGRPVHAGAALA
jgi:phytanoyl-CoA hydroxylase